MDHSILSMEAWILCPINKFLARICGHRDSKLGRKQTMQQDQDQKRCSKRAFLLWTLVQLWWDVKELVPARCPPASPTWLLLQGGVGNNPHERMRGRVVLTHEDVCVFNGCNRRTNQRQTKRLCPRLELLASMSVSSFCEINLFSWIKKLKSIPFFGWCKDISDKTSDHVSRLHTFSNSTVNYTADQMITLMM